MQDSPENPLSAFQILGGSLIALLATLIIVLTINLCSAFIMGKIDGHPTCGDDENCLTAIFP